LELFGKLVFKTSVVLKDPTFKTIGDLSSVLKDKQGTKTKAKDNIIEIWAWIGYVC